MGRRFLLVSWAGTPKILSDFIPDNGLASLAGSLMARGHEVKILDLNEPRLLARLVPADIRRSLEPFARKVFIEKGRPSAADIARLRIASWRLERAKRRPVAAIIGEIVALVRRERFDCVGFKLWAGEGFAWSLVAAARIRRDLPAVRLLGGGPQVDIFGQEIFAAGGVFDALVFGEGEEAIGALGDLADGAPPAAVPNTIYRENGRVVRTARAFVDPLDSLPAPVYDPAVYEGIGRRIRLVVLDESRGCPNRCSFCIHPVKSGRRRTRSPERVVAEMLEHRRRGVRLFRYAGSNTPADLMRAVAERLIAAGAGVSYAAFASAAGFEGADFFPLLRRSGCRALFFGVETANEDILKRAMNRSVSRAAMERVLSASRAAGIFTVASVIHPAPFETPQTRAETLAFIGRVRPDSVLVQFPGVYPGTEWFDDPARFGFGVDRARYPRRVMTYQIKSLFPPRYWKPLPYTVNGMPFARFAAETERFQRDVQALGVNTSVSDEAFLLFERSGFRSLDEFLSVNRAAFFCGDPGPIEDEIARINGGEGQ